MCEETINTIIPQISWCLSVAYHSVCRFSISQFTWKLGGCLSSPYIELFCFVEWLESVCDRSRVIVFISKSQRQINLLSQKPNMGKSYLLSSNVRFPLSTWFVFKFYKPDKEESEFHPKVQHYWSNCGPPQNCLMFVLCTMKVETNLLWLNQCYKLKLGKPFKYLMRAWVWHGGLSGLCNSECKGE